MSGTNPPHTNNSRCIAELEKGHDKSGNAVPELKYNECGKQFGKIPEENIFCNETMCDRFEPIISIEVSNTHESFDL